MDISIRIPLFAMRRRWYPLGLEMQYCSYLHSAMRVVVVGMAGWVTSRAIVYNTDTAYDTILLLEPEKPSGRHSDGRINVVDSGVVVTISYFLWEHIGEFFS